MYPPLANVAGLVRSDVCREMIGVDFDYNRSSLLNDSPPWPCSFEFYGGADKTARIAKHFGIGVVGSHRLDAATIW